MSADQRLAPIPNTLKNQINNTHDIGNARIGGDCLFPSIRNGKTVDNNQRYVGGHGKPKRGNPNSNNRCRYRPHLGERDI